MMGELKMKSNFPKMLKFLIKVRKKLEEEGRKEEKS